MKVDRPKKKPIEKARGLHRREWLREAAAGILGASAARALVAGGGLLLPLIDTAEALAEPLRQPSELVGALIATPGTGAVWSGRSTSLLTFGGTYPSPTLRARRGETFELLLQNRLTEATNIHWHGLTVPSEVDGYPTDLVLPGGARQYRFQIAQPAGTYWYHPHPDGRTAAQVYGGMAGFFIVEGDAERALGLPTGEQDVAPLLQDRRRASDNSLTYAPTPMDLMSGYLGNTVLVNGTADAELSLRARGTQGRVAAQCHQTAKAAGRGDPVQVVRSRLSSLARSCSPSAWRSSSRQSSRERTPSSWGRSPLPMPPWRRHLPRWR